MTKVTSIPYGDKSVEKSGSDPLKYNRGQVIHQNSLLESCNVDTARDRAVGKLYNSDVVKNTICVDWFQVYITVQKLEVWDPLIASKPVEQVYVNDHILLVYSGNGTTYFEKLYKVYLYGIHYGNMEVDTRRPDLFDYNAAIIKLNNEILYTATWLEDFKYIISEMGAKVESITRLDIAIDGDDQPIQMLQKWNKSNTIERKGKAIVRFSLKNDKSVESVIVGKPKSDKQISIYEKLQEIAKSNKTYITEFWKNNGLQTDDKVWRTELRMSSKVANCYDWERLDDPAYLASIVRTELKNYLEFYYKGKDSNKHRTYKSNSMEIINFDNMGGKLLDKRENKPPSDVYRAKQTIKNMMREAYVNGIKDIDGIIQHYSLGQWAEVMREKCIPEWEKDRRIRLMTVDIRESSN